MNGTFAWLIASMHAFTAASLLNVTNAKPVHEYFCSSNTSTFLACSCNF